jgi:ketosteroid isomerase-like protein
VPAQLPAPVAAVIDAVNAGDTIGFLDSFTPDGVVDDWGRRFTDREAIRAWSNAEFIGANGRLTVTKVAADGNTAEVTADWRSSRANGLSLFEFRLNGDKIALMRITAG